MFLIAALTYAISIFIDLSTYYLKYYVQDKDNIRYLLSLINIFQYTARAFVLIFNPIAAYYTETIKDKDVVWMMTLLCHVFVIILLLPLFSVKFGKFFSKVVILILNFVFGRKKTLNLIVLDGNYTELKFSKKNFLVVLLSFIAGFLFSVSITFLYYISFYFPSKALTLSSYTQIINLIGSMIFILLLDPIIMSAIDKHKGLNEIFLLTLGRILAHISLIIILILIYIYN